MNYKELVEQIKIKKSFLCIGLDPEYEKIPEHLKHNNNPLFAFNKQIIDNTAQYCIAYKPNLAFYESCGIEGWKSFELTVDYIRKHYPNIFIIADAKRGDIGNTSKLYAKTFFENINCDAITLSPYMGEDSISPFLTYDNKWAILLALTSNNGSLDFQHLTANNEFIFESVIRKSQTWNNNNQIMYVVGATQAKLLEKIRKIIPEHFLLIPGVGAQGGSLDEVAKYGINKNCGLIVNSSRAIIFADNTENFASIAKQKAIEIQKEMENILKKYEII